MCKSHFLILERKKNLAQQEWLQTFKGTVLVFMVGWVGVLVHVYLYCMCEPNFVHVCV